jgi:hypothetical protein
MSEGMNRPDFTVSVIGCGGIGSWLLHGLVRPLNRFAQAKGLRIEIRVYDSDKVERDNLHHQCFKLEDLGKHKVVAVFEELEQFHNDQIRIIPCAWDVRKDDDFTHSHIAVVAVDSTPARRFIIESGKVDSWAICTCAADSFMFIDETAKREAVDLVTKANQAPASCQIPGAISNGKIEAGHLAVAVVAQTWILHSLRGLSGESGSMKPKPRADSVILGTLGSVSGEKEGAE